MNDELIDTAETPDQYAIGLIQAVSGNSATCCLDGHVINMLRDHPDASIARCGTPGSMIRVIVGDHCLLANLRDIYLNAHDELMLTATVDFLGEGIYEDGNIRGFRRGVTQYPRPGDKVFGVSSEILSRAFSPNEKPHIEIGTIFPTSDTRASLLIDPMLSMHFAILGSTGTGKSTTAALILHQIIRHSPDGHIMILDPHGEYGKAFAHVGVQFNVDNLKLPYWLMNFEEHCEVFINSEGMEYDVNRDVLAKCLLMARLKNNISLGLNGVTVDSPLPYQFSDLLDALNQEMGKLEKASLVNHYNRLKIGIEETIRDPRYHFMFDRGLSTASMEDFISRILRLPSDGKPVSLIDLSGVPSEIINVVVGLLARIVLDFAIWSREERTNPILLVCEEAQRYLSSSAASLNSPVRRNLERIAKEGRKYGVSLGLVSQRPSDLSETALSQCGTYITLRLNSERDQERIRMTLPDSARGYVDTIAALINRECIISGEGVTVPIRVSLDYLDKDRRPQSEDPSYSAAWGVYGGEEAAIQRAIKRWRRQGLETEV